MCFGRTPEQGNGGSTRISVYKHARYCHIISLHAVASQPIGHNSRFKVPHMVLPFHLATCTRTHVHTHISVFIAKCSKCACIAVHRIDMHHVSQTWRCDRRLLLLLLLSLSLSLPPSLRVTVAQLSMLVDVFFLGFARQVPCSRRTPLIEWSALTRRHWGLLDRGAIWSISKRKTRTAPDRNA